VRPGDRYFANVQNPDKLTEGWSSSLSIHDTGVKESPAVAYAGGRQVPDRGTGEPTYVGRYALVVKYYPGQGMAVTSESLSAAHVQSVPGYVFGTNKGSGSIVGESQGIIVVMQKESQTQFVHRIGLGKRETISDEASELLPQSIVPSLNMGREAGLFARRSMLLRRDDQRVSFPKVTVAMSRSIPGWYLLPQFLTGRPACGRQ